MRSLSLPALLGAAVAASLSCGDSTGPSPLAGFISQVTAGGMQATVVRGDPPAAGGFNAVQLFAPTTVIEGGSAEVQLSAAGASFTKVFVRIPGTPDPAHAREVERDPYALTCGDLARQPEHTESQKLVIRAELSQAVTAGGTMISAYTGVDAVFAQALGEHGSASGFSSPGTARVGPISVNAGALVYGVSMAADGLVGMERPSGFTWITGMADDGAGDYQVDGEYVVHGGGSVDPEWVWSFFSAPDTGRASVLALNPRGAFTAAPSLRTIPGAP